jgi:acyl carrier protein
MDAFALEQSNKRQSPWISANWDGWPTEEVSVDKRRFQTSIDQFAMTREECTQAFERVLSRALPRIVVSAGDLESRLQQWTSGARLPSQQAFAVETGSKNGTTPKESRSSFHSRPNLPNPYIAPGTPTELRLCRIWRDLFGIDEIGANDNFFDLRGDSLLAAQLIAGASKVFKLEVPIRSIFEHSTVATLAQRIDELQWSAQALQTAPEIHMSEDEEEGRI